MKKLWLVAWNEYRRHVLRKRFIFVILSLPLFLVVIGAVILIAAGSEYNSNPVGYVDRSGLFSRVAPEPVKNAGLFGDSALQAFPDEETARSALDRKSIQAYYVIEPDYMATGRVKLVSQTAPGLNIQEPFTQFLRANLVDGQPAPVARRVLDGSNFIVRAPDGSRQMDSRNWLDLVVPLLSGVLLIVVINTSGGYLLQAVVEEKENRTMEIIVTSVSANQLMAGKVIGNMSVGLTQLVIWLALPVAFLVATGGKLGSTTLHMDPQFIWLMVVTLLAAFVMISALMAAIGATATESREAQQVAGLFTLPIVAPYWFTTSIMTNPNGPVARGLSYFPLTAPLTLPLRAVFTTLPAWEIALNLALLIAVAVLSVWLAGRAFRLGMLQYGKRLSLKELFRFRPFRG